MPGKFVNFLGPSPPGVIGKGIILQGLPRATRRTPGWRPGNDFCFQLSCVVGPAPSPFHEKKERVQAKRVVRWRISIFLGPQRRSFVLARGR